jgi:hypothetical protein
LGGNEFHRLTYLVSAGLGVGNMFPVLIPKPRKDEIVYGTFWGGSEFHVFDISRLCGALEWTTCFRFSFPKPRKDEIVNGTFWEVMSSIG